MTAPPPPCGDETCTEQERCSCALDCGMPPAAEGSCVDLIDGDCDMATDCADADCSADPVCVPTSGGPPQAGLAADLRWDDVHSVDCVTAENISMSGPAPIGACVHHLNDQGPAGRRATMLDPRWWPDSAGDGLLFTGEDHLLFTDESSPPNQLEWIATTIDPWAVAFVGYFHRSGSWLGSPMVGGNTTLIDTVVAGASWHRTRHANSPRIIFTQNAAATNERHALVIEKDGSGFYNVFVRRHCGVWESISNGSNVGLTRPDGVLGCVNCYYPCGWLREDGTPEPCTAGLMFLRELMLYSGFDSSQRQQLFDYLDAEHGDWIDEGCPTP